MKTIKFFLLALILGTVATQSVQAQMDPLEYIQRLEQQFGMQAEMYARQAVEAYREETGDYDTPDLQVWNHVDAMARQQNPDFYQNLQARENAFMQQQQAYHQNSMAILDGLQSSYMNRSNSDYQSHQDYIREGIWNRSNYSDGYGNVYELPQYDPGYYQADDGTEFYQDEYGDYYYDR